MLNMLIRIIRTEGVAGAFKGFSANMINSFSMRECGAVSAGAGVGSEASSAMTMATDGM